MCSYSSYPTPDKHHQHHDHNHRHCQHRYRQKHHHYHQHTIIFRATLTSAHIYQFALVTMITVTVLQKRPFGFGGRAQTRLAWHVVGLQVTASAPRKINRAKKLKHLHKANMFGTAQRLGVCPSTPKTPKITRVTDFGKAWYQPGEPGLWTASSRQKGCQ